MKTVFNYFYKLVLLTLIATNSYGQNIVVNPYLQNVQQEQITVMWEVGETGQGSVMWGLSPFDLNHTVTSTTNNVNGTSHIHTAVITNLTAKTKYYYKVIMAEGQSSIMRSFVTLSLSSDEEPIQLIAISDMQRDGSQPDKFREIIEEGIIPIIDPDGLHSLTDLEGILIPGDLVATGGNYSQWKNFFFTPADSIIGYVPIYPVPGNHEYFSGGLPNFKHYFSLPQNGAAGLEDECWFQDISNVRIIGLNSNSGTADKITQLDWLSSVLSEACANDHIDFVFAQLHHPFKSELWTPGESGFTGQVIDSLQQFSTDCGKASIHFFGHTHGYSRGQSRDHKHLWINVATAGGAIDNWGEFPNADYEEFVKSQDEYGFVHIDVTADDDPQFTIRRYGRGDQDVTEDNQLRDQITILNNEIKPSTPKNIFPDGDTIQSNCIVLKGSQFYGLEDTIQGAHWQVSTDNQFNDNIIQEHWKQSENWYNKVNLQALDDLTDIEIDPVQSSTQYHWRIRYRNQNLEWSDWSTSTTFYVDGENDILTNNLVINGDAENGISNWSGDIESLEDAECNSVLPYEGLSNFGVGGICANESDEGIAFQIIDLSTYESDIDTDSVSINYSAYIRNFNGSDIPELYIELYDDGVLITTSPIISNTTGEWIKKSNTLKLDVGIDECRIYLKGTRVAGSDNDSYFDNIEAYLVSGTGCPSCVGKSNEDNDMDGYCDDIDCNDKNANIYPGALEICDGLDNDCDGIFDTSDTIIWTNLGGNNLWSTPSNWDQNMVPLPCQHVVIIDNGNVNIEEAASCKSLEIDNVGSLNIGTEGTLLVISNNNNYPSIKVNGSMFINGELVIRNSNNAAIEISGTLTNNSKIKSTQTSLESIVIKSGGRFDDFGKTILK